MNFLSHFYHEFPCKDAYFACGVLLPDVLSNFSTRNHEIVKVHAQKLTASLNDTIQAIGQGVKKHYVVDEFFHGSDFFAANTKTIEQLLKKYAFTCFQKRMYAFSHVFLELMLDRKILLEELEVCNVMYNLLNEIQPAHLTTFISENTKATHPEKVTEHFLLFCKQRFIYDYLKTDVLIQILNRINQRLGNAGFSETDKTHLTTAIYETDTVLHSQNFPKFLP